MARVDLSHLADQIASCDPQNALHRSGILSSLGTARQELRLRSGGELNGCLDAAAMLTAFLPNLRPADCGEALRIVARLVRLAESPGASDEAWLDVPPPASRVEPPSRQEAPSPAPEQEDGSDESGLSPALERVNDTLLGAVLIDLGVLSPKELEIALAIQAETGKRLGESMVAAGVASWEQVMSGLQEQRVRRTRSRAAQASRTPEELEPETSATAPGPYLKPSGGGLRLVTDVMLGEILVGQGHLTQEELDRALRLQRATGTRLGETLVDMRRISRQQLEQALRLQAGRRKRGA